MNPCLQLLSDWRNQSRLGPTDRGRPLGKGQETDGESKATHSSQPQYQGPYHVHLPDSTLRPSWHNRTKQCCRRRHFPLQCCGRHQLPYQTNIVRLPPYASGHQQCCGRRHLPYQANTVRLLPHASGHQQCCGRHHLPYQANMVKPPIYLWATIVW